tara:strand:+ start:552 stop:749 length:198 start_codon:yes stop_codon:yes gene_type:complete
MMSDYLKILLISSWSICLLSCSYIEKYSFYEIFINPEVEQISKDKSQSAQKPDIESVPEKVIINE